MKTPVMMKMAVAVAAAFVCVSADSADVSTREKRVGARCWEDVRVLSDDAIGRAAGGKPGPSTCRRVRGDNFRKAGLKPGGNGGYLQEVRLESRQIVEAHSSAQLAWPATRFAH